MATVYETNTFNSFLKDILHPGGLELTRRVAEIARIDENSQVLDIACGKGEGCLLIAEEYDCRVTGIDISSKSVALAQSRATAKGLDHRVRFIVSDAENLPFIDATFDAVVSECSFSILPDKVRAASEINRVLKSNGRLVITDIILKKRVLDKIQVGLTPDPRLPLLPCIAGARSLEDYVMILEQTGFINPYIEDHAKALKKLAYEIAVTFGGWEEFLQQLSLELSSEPCSKDFASSVEAYRQPFAQGEMGYALIRVTKP